MQSGLAVRFDWAAVPLLPRADRYAREGSPSAGRGGTSATTGRTCRRERTCRSGCGRCSSTPRPPVGSSPRWGPSTCRRSSSSSTASPPRLARRRGRDGTGRGAAAMMRGSGRTSWIRCTRRCRRLTGAVFTADQFGRDLLTNFGHIHHWTPRFVVEPRTAQDVVEVVRFAGARAPRVHPRHRPQPEPARHQPGRHPAGDAVALEILHVDREAHTVDVEGGVVWRDLVHFLKKFSLVPRVLTNNLGVTIGARCPSRASVSRPSSTARRGQRRRRWTWSPAPATSSPAARRRTPTSSGPRSPGWGRWGSSCARA